MVTNGNRRADERVRIETLGIGQRNQHLAKYLSISLSQNADTPNPSWTAATFNWAGFHERQPIRDGVEAPNGCPHLLGGRSYHAADKNLRHSGYCAATVRDAISSFSRSMLLVSSSGKTIGSPFFPG